MPTNAIKKQLHLYFGVDGTLLDKSGDVFANPQDDETFEINAYIEDGVVNNQTTLINFTPNDRTAYTSHWFTMFYRELVDYIVPNESEPRNFAKFTITVPSIVLLIKGGKVQFEQRITIVQRYGNTHLGNFETVTDLNVAYPPSGTLDDNNDVAFVYSNESGETAQVGFYQVEFIGGVYAWVKKETLLYNLQTKQYNVLGFTVNVGMANPSGVPTISESVIYQLMQEISHVYIDINALEIQVIENKDTIENMLDGTTPFKVVSYDTTYSGEIAIGQTKWNDTFKCLETRVSDNVVIQHGQENLQYVRSVSSIQNGQAVYFVGSTGQRMEVSVAGNTSQNQARGTIAIATENFTPSGELQWGFVCTYGLVNGIKTNYAGWSTGDTLWLSANGELTNSRPNGTAYRVRVGVVGRVHGTDGSVFVAPQYYPTMGDLSQVDTSNPQTGDIYVRQANGSFINSQRLVTAEGKVSTLETKTTNLETANMIKSYTYNPSTHVLTFTYYDNTTTSFDLPLESAIVDASYDNVTKDITFTLQSGATLVVPLDDLISGLANETWVTTYFIPKTSIVDNLTTDDATKVLSAKQGKALQDTKEALANKKSVINDSEVEYPNSKAIFNIGLDTPIKDLDGKTLREVYFYGNLSNGATWSGASPVVVTGNEIVRTIPTGAPTLTSYRVTSTIPINDGNTYYLSYETKYTATLDVFYYLKVSNLWGFASPTQEYQVVEDIFTRSGSYQVLFFDFLNNLTTSDEVKLYLRNVLVLNLTALNFTNKSREVLDFWWNVYKQIVFSSVSNLTLNDINKLSQFLEQKNKYFLTSPINGLFEHIDRTYVDYSSNYTTLQHTAIYDLYDNLLIGNEDYISYEVVDTITVSAVQKEIRKYTLKPVQPMGSLDKIPKIIIVASQHGFEKMSAITTYNMIYDIINHWQESELLAFLRFNVEFIIFPVLNVSGFDTYERQNYNGVDLNRNYPIGWVYQGSGTSTYSGDYALSEKETQAVSETIKNNKDTIMLIDFHNFFTPSYEPTDSVWISATSTKGQLIGTNFIRTITSFFRRKYSNVEDVQNIGYISGGYRARGGYLDVYGDYNGMNGETIEVGYKFNGIVGTVPYDIVSQKLNEETFVNYILQKLRVLIDG